LNEQLRRLGNLLADYGAHMLAGAFVLLINRLRRRLRPRLTLVPNLEVQTLVTKETEMEAKVLDIKMDGEYFSVTVDPNKNGVPVLDLRIHISEIPAEVVSAFSKKA